ncbi:restriction endonuclease subunit S [Vibrio sp. HN007]|uniref:restriction endonuclease subunit S n=1 Tax=Vibrio iocasae TaxID=3098914 RepID=UPI0035D4891D
MVPNGWKDGRVGDLLLGLESGVSVNGEDRQMKNGEKGVLKVSAVSYGIFDRNATKVIDSPNELHRAKTNPKQGQIIISRSNTEELVGASAYIERDFSDLFLPDKLWQTLPKPNSDMKWLSYVLASEHSRYTLSNLATGTSGSMKNITKGELLGLKIGIPPLPEQRKIAKILSTWDKAIATNEKLIETSKQQKKALMQQLLTGKKRLLNPETGKVFEKDWEEVRLIDTAGKEKYSFTGGPFGSDLKSSDYTQSGVRIIQLQNIGDGCFHNSYQIFTSQQKANELASCNIFPGDIIISKMGDPVARATIIPAFHQRYLMASDGIRLAVDRSKYNNNFILEMVNYSNFRNNALSKSTGSTRKRIGLTDLKNIRLKIPQLEEQQKIASVLSIANKEIEVLEAKLSHLKQEKKALMQQLLTGKRRVKVEETEAA